ncbi:NHL repeat-containing protein [Spirochaeta africana]|uniref:NHL repeat protein n=1 Tax=Spirochaeta africana (strain ATCC 700263 / DSM 8902 / Z-7692) TaxID=889378 RepID=H9UKD9_SPIAZ|nr:NHL repeat-containing protein [Spirochaeta africana]AFG37982.1 hypothetical protein Spiaf_1931 [Spirochaeta africana DSM 8902]
MRRFCLIFLFLTAVLPIFAQQAATFSDLAAQEEFRHGVLAFHAGHFNEAVLAFQRAAAAAPEAPLIRQWLGRAYAQAGFWDAAAGEWDEVVAAGQAPIALLQRMEILQERTGLAPELAGRERYVLAAEISGHSAEYSIFRRPTSIRPLPDGTSIVTAFGSHTITVLDPNGNRRRELLGGVTGLDGPYDVLPLPDGRILVSEFMGDRISLLNERGNRIASFGERGRGDGQLLGPQFMTIDSREHLYVTDWGNRLVRKFTLEGEYLFSIGAPEPGFDGLRRPTGVLWWNDELWVADAERGVLQVFDESGNHLQTVSHDRISEPQMLDAYDHETLLVVDSNAILLLQPDNLDSVVIDDSATRKLTAAAVDANGNIVAVDHDRENMVVFTQVSQLYAGMHVTIQRVNADRFPEVTIELTVEDRAGRPIVGLDRRNFVIADPGGTSQQLETIYQGWDAAAVHTALLLDMEPPMQSLAAPVQQHIENLYDLGISADTWRIVSAGWNPVLEADSGDGGATAAARASQVLAQADGGAIDQGIRFAADGLLQKRGRSQIVLVTAGGQMLPEFETYGEIELARYLQQNHIRFSVLRVGDGQIDSRLMFLVEETGGTVVDESEPRGLLPLMEHARTAPDGWYTLRYRSDANSDFGRRFLPLSVESLLLQRSGRDELGFFAPLEF